MLSKERSAPRARGISPLACLSWKPMRAACLALLFALCAWPVPAQQSSADLTNQSLEDLMNTQVTSVSKKDVFGPMKSGQLRRSADAKFMWTFK